MLEIKNLQVRYCGAKNLSIEDISLEVKKGDRIAILGPSGCGKTTLLHVIARLLDNKNAEIKGRFFYSPEIKTRMVFQEATLLPWRTVEKNVALGLEIKKIPKDEIQKKVKDILKTVGLLENANQFPNQLSIGMQQRVNFARAIVCQPDLLLLDEPFSALDVETKKNLQEEFLKILREKEITSIFVTHSIQEAVVMANRIVVLTGSPARVKQIIENNSQSVIFDNQKSLIENLQLYD